MQRALVERAMDGDADAFDVLARNAGDRLMAIAYRIVRDRTLAEDAVQAALLSAWRQVPALRDPDRFDAWLHRLLVHACYAELERARRAGGNVQLLPSHQGPGRPDEIGAVADRDQLERAFRRLPPEQRAVFVFHHHVGLTLGEVADQLGIPLGTVKSRLHYAASSLRAALAADARTATSGERIA